VTPGSLTGPTFRGEVEIAVPATRRRGTGWALCISGARHKNLRDINVAIPLGTLTCITGMSGSGEALADRRRRSARR